MGIPGWKMGALMALPVVILVLTLGLSIWLGRRRYQAGKPPLPWLLDIADKVSAGRGDEMERMIQYKASSWAYLVVIIGLVVVNFYELHRSGKIPLSNGVLIAAVLTQAFASLILRHRSTQGDEEYKSYPLWLTFAVVLGGAAALAAIGAAVVIVILAV